MVLHCGSVLCLCVSYIREMALCILGVSVKETRVLVIDIGDLLTADSCS
jgi:hypothetical protein